MVCSFFHWQGQGSNSGVRACAVRAFYLIQLSCQSSNIDRSIDLICLSCLSVCLSVRQGLTCVALSGLELTEFRLPLPPER